MKRVLTVDNILSKKFETLPFKDNWYNAFGEPERHGVWFGSGNSTNGKSALMVQAAKYLSQFGKVLIDDLEEAGRKSMQDAFKRFGLSSAPGKILVVSENLKELSERLSKPRSPEFVIINSVQYLRGIKSADFYEFKAKHPNKLLFFLSHVEGTKPVGKLARDIKYDADLKIWVEGFKAISLGRYYGPDKEMILWNEEAANYHGTNIKQTIK